MEYGPEKTQSALSVTLYSRSIITVSLLFLASFWVGDIGDVTLCKGMFH